MSSSFGYAQCPIQGLASTNEHTHSHTKMHTRVPTQAHTDECTCKLACTHALKHHMHHMLLEHPCPRSPAQPSVLIPIPADDSKYTHFLVACVSSTHEPGVWPVGIKPKFALAVKLI
jgi:hypothetical protein